MAASRFVFPHRSDAQIHGLVGARTIDQALPVFVVVAVVGLDLPDLHDWGCDVDDEDQSGDGQARQPCQNRMFADY